jgi:hypothetical protein
MDITSNKSLQKIDALKNQKILLSEKAILKLAQETKNKIRISLNKKQNKDAFELISNFFIEVGNMIQCYKNIIYRLKNDVFFKNINELIINSFKESFSKEDFELILSVDLDSFNDTTYDRELYVYLITNFIDDNKNKYEIIKNNIKNNVYTKKRLYSLDNNIYVYESLINDELLNIKKDCTAKEYFDLAILYSEKARVPLAKNEYLNNIFYLKDTIEEKIHYLKIPFENNSYKNNFGISNIEENITSNYLSRKNFEYHINLFEIGLCFFDKEKNKEDVKNIFSKQDFSKQDFLYFLNNNKNSNFFEVSNLMLYLDDMDFSNIEEKDVFQERIEIVLEKMLKKEVEINKNKIIEVLNNNSIIKRIEKNGVFDSSLDAISNVLNKNKDLKNLFSKELFFENSIKEEDKVNALSLYLNSIKKEDIDMVLDNKKMELIINIRLNQKVDYRKFANSEVLETINSFYDKNKKLINKFVESQIIKYYDEVKDKNELDWDEQKKKDLKIKNIVDMFNLLDNKDKYISIEKMNNFFIENNKNKLGNELSKKILYNAIFIPSKDFNKNPYQKYEIEHKIEKKIGLNKKIKKEEYNLKPLSNNELFKFTKDSLKIKIEEYYLSDDDICKVRFDLNNKEDFENIPRLHQIQFINYINKKIIKNEDNESKKDFLKYICESEEYKIAEAEAFKNKIKHINSCHSDTFTLNEKEYNKDKINEVLDLKKYILSDFFIENKEKKISLGFVDKDLFSNFKSLSELKPYFYTIFYNTNFIDDFNINENYIKKEIKEDGESISNFNYEIFYKEVDFYKKEFDKELKDKKEKSRLLNKYFEPILEENLLFKDKEEILIAFKELTSYILNNNNSNEELFSYFSYKESEGLLGSFFDVIKENIILKEKYLVIKEELVIIRDDFYKELIKRIDLEKIYTKDKIMFQKEMNIILDYAFVSNIRNGKDEILNILKDKFINTFNTKEKQLELYLSLINDITKDSNVIEKRLKTKANNNNKFDYFFDTNIYTKNCGYEVELFFDDILFSKFDEFKEDLLLAEKIQDNLLLLEKHIHKETYNALFASSVFNSYFSNESVLEEQQKVLFKKDTKIYTLKKELNKEDNLIYLFEDSISQKYSTVVESKEKEIESYLNNKYEIFNKKIIKAINYNSNKNIDFLNELKAKNRKIGKELSKTIDMFVNDSNENNNIDKRLKYKIIISKINEMIKVIGNDGFLFELKNNNIFLNIINDLLSFDNKEKLDGTYYYKKTLNSMIEVLESKNEDEYYKYVSNPLLSKYYEVYLEDIFYPRSPEESHYRENSNIDIIETNGAILNNMKENSKNLFSLELTYKDYEIMNKILCSDKLTHEENKTYKEKEVIYNKFLENNNELFDNLENLIMKLNISKKLLSKKTLFITINNLVIGSNKEINKKKIVALNVFEKADKDNKEYFYFLNNITNKNILNDDKYEFSLDGYIEEDFDLEFDKNNILKHKINFLEYLDSLNINKNKKVHINVFKNATLSNFSNKDSNIYEYSKKGLAIQKEYEYAFEDAKEKKYNIGYIDSFLEVDQNKNNLSNKFLSLYASPLYIDLSINELKNDYMFKHYNDSMLKNYKFIVNDENEELSIKEYKENNKELYYDNLLKLYNWTFKKIIIKKENSLSDILLLLKAFNNGNEIDIKSIANKDKNELNVLELLFKHIDFEDSYVHIELEKYINEKITYLFSNNNSFNDNLIILKSLSNLGKNNNILKNIKYYLREKIDLLLRLYKNYIEIDNKEALNKYNNIKSYEKRKELSDFYSTDILTNEDDEIAFLNESILLNKEEVMLIKKSFLLCKELLSPILKEKGFDEIVEILNKYIEPLETNEKNSMFVFFLGEIDNVKDINRLFELFPSNKIDLFENNNLFYIDLFLGFLDRGADSIEEHNLFKSLMKEYLLFPEKNTKKIELEKIEFMLNNVENTDGLIKVANVFLEEKIEEYFDGIISFEELSNKYLFNENIINEKLKDVVKSNIDNIFLKDGYDVVEKGIEENDNNDNNVIIESDEYISEIDVIKEKLNNILFEQNSLLGLSFQSIQKIQYLLFNKLDKEVMDWVNENLLSENNEKINQKKEKINSSNNSLSIEYYNELLEEEQIFMNKLNDVVNIQLDIIKANDKIKEKNQKIKENGKEISAASNILLKNNNLKIEEIKNEIENISKNIKKIDVLKNQISSSIIDINRKMHNSINSKVLIFLSCIKNKDIAHSFIERNKYITMKDVDFIKYNELSDNIFSNNNKNNKEKTKETILENTYSSLFLEKANNVEEYLNATSFFKKDVFDRQVLEGYNLVLKEITGKYIKLNLQGFQKNLLLLNNNFGTNELDILKMIETNDNKNLAIKSPAIVLSLLFSENNELFIEFVNIIKNKHIDLEFFHNVLGEERFVKIILEYGFENVLELLFKLMKNNSFFQSNAFDKGLTYNAIINERKGLIQKIMGQIDFIFKENINNKSISEILNIIKNNKFSFSSKEVSKDFIEALKSSKEEIILEIEEDNNHGRYGVSYDRGFENEVEELTELLEKVKKQTIGFDSKLIKESDENEKNENKHIELNEISYLKNIYFDKENNIVSITERLPVVDTRTLFHGIASACCLVPLGPAGNILHYNLKNPTKTSVDVGNYPIYKLSEENKQIMINLVNEYNELLMKSNFTYTKGLDELNNKIKNKLYDLGFEIKWSSTCWKKENTFCQDNVETNSSKMVFDEETQKMKRIKVVGDEIYDSLIKINNDVLLIEEYKYINELLLKENAHFIKRKINNVTVGTGNSDIGFDRFLMVDKNDLVVIDSTYYRTDANNQYLITNSDKSKKYLSIDYLEKKYNGLSKFELERKKEYIYKEIENAILIKNHNKIKIENNKIINKKNI